MTNDDNNLPSSTSKISSVKNSSSSNLQSYFETSGDQRTPSNISLKEVVFFTGNTAVDQTITHGILHLYRSKKSYGFRDRIEYDEDDDDEEDQEDCSIGMDELGLIDSEMILLYWWGLKNFSRARLIFVQIKFFDRTLFFIQYLLTSPSKTSSASSAPTKTPSSTSKYSKPPLQNTTWP